jgi:hypothetical protein
MRHDVQSSNVVIALISECDVTCRIVATLSFDSRFGAAARIKLHIRTSSIVAVPQRYFACLVAALTRDCRDTNGTNRVHSAACFDDHDSFTDFVISRAVS